MIIGEKLIKSDLTVEGGLVHAFMQDALKGFDAKGWCVLEVGPKHGMHTKLFDELGAASFTLIELPEKRNQQHWIKDIKAPVKVFYEDLLRIDFSGPTTGNTFDVILFCGVIYHNTEQLRLLKKLRTVVHSDTVLVFESSTTRSDDLIDKNVIEVHWPKPYRDTKTVIFYPSKQACRSLLEMAGWKVIITSDDEELKSHSNPHRFSCVCTPGDIMKTYDDIDHEEVPST